MHNHNERVSPNYSIIKDLAQTPCAMTSFQLLQSYPMQRTMLLSAIEVLDSSSQLVMKFYSTDVKPHLPYHVAFYISVIYNNHHINRTIVNERDSTCVISLSCWNDISSPNLTPSWTLWIDFNG
jgi:hypothetical protein